MLGCLAMSSSSGLSLSRVQPRSTQAKRTQQTLRATSALDEKRECLLCMKSAGQRVQGLRILKRSAFGDDLPALSVAVKTAR